MADVQDLHQIEYRHHQTNDLSPVASSMPSKESQNAWDSRIRAWVRHPHSEVLSESACYQVFSNGQAALALRYWDEQAASRADGTLGRPLVSRVLVGPASVLTPEAAIVTCRQGLSADWVGMLPGRVPDGRELPMASGAALTALTREMTPGLDRASATQPGLHAVVAAALSEPTVPLAISVHDVLIQAPLRDSVQCPLLWGLRRITGPLLGLVGRGWSFSTFELPLGQMDPASLPGIVFRETRDVGQAPPSRWRRETRVRPFAEGALGDDVPYAGMIERAGWLVAEYQERGGEELERFIADCGGSSGSLAARMANVSDALQRAHRPAGVSGHRRMGGFFAGRGQVQPTEPPGSGQAEQPLAAAALAGEAVGSQAAALSSLAAEAAEATSLELGSWDARNREPEVTPPADAPLDAQEPGSARSPAVPLHEEPAEVLPQEAARARQVQAQWDSTRPDAARFSDQWHHEEQPPDQVGPRAAGLPVVNPAGYVAGTALPDQGRPAGRHRGQPAEEAEVDGAPLARASMPQETGSPADPPSGESLAGYGWSGYPGDSLGSSRAREEAPPLPPSVRGGPPASIWSTPGDGSLPGGNQEPVSSLLKRLEWPELDPAEFDSILDAIHRVGILTPEESRRSWSVISSNDWYGYASRLNGFGPEDLAVIFGLVVIPDLDGAQPGAERIARWALEAPPPMIEGLLNAASTGGVGTRETAMRILEPALAYRWTAEHRMPGLWDKNRAVRPEPAPARRDDTGALRWLRRLLGRQ